MKDLRLFASLLVGVACSDSSSILSDAVPPDQVVEVNDANIEQPPPEVFYNYDCPTTHPKNIAAMITARGMAQRFAGATVLATPETTITTYRIGPTGDQLLDTVQTGTDGVFLTNPLPANHAPLDGYLKASKAGFWTTYVYPPSAIAMNLIDVNVILLTDDTVQFAEYLANTTQQPGYGIVAVDLGDCARPANGVADATVEIYAGANTVGEATLEIAQFIPIERLDGFYLILNVPPGALTVKASYFGHTFLENDLTVRADAITTVGMMPGYPPLPPVF